MTRILGEGGITMHILMVADTSDFGVARIIADTPNAAVQILRDAGLQVKLVDVVAVKIPDRAGGLAELLSALDEKSINVEYAYCVSAGGGEYAVDIFRLDSTDGIDEIVENLGFKTLRPEEIYVVD
jgi:hypothetical protein